MTRVEHRARTRALFLDRDGILNAVVIRQGKVSSPRTLDEFRLLEEIKPLLHEARRLGYVLWVVTNQPDVARGCLAREDLERMHQQIRQTFPIDGIEACLSAADDDPRRKPNPGMLLEVAQRLSIDLKRSLFVGDGEKDVLAGRAAGLRTVLLETEYNRSIHGIADFNCRSLDDIRLLLQESDEQELVE